MSTPHQKSHSKHPTNLATAKAEAAKADAKADAKAEAKAATAAKSATAAQAAATSKLSIQTGMNLQGESIENWANLTLQDCAKILKLDETSDDRMSALIDHTIGLMGTLPEESTAKRRSVELCDGLILPNEYEEDWSLNTLKDLALVLGLPAGATLRELTAHARMVQAEIEAAA